MLIAQWHECEKMTGPGIVFELKNAEGQRCVALCRAGAGQTLRLEVAAGNVPRGRRAQASALDADAAAKEQIRSNRLLKNVSEFIWGALKA